ncbi:unnamed protein product [Hyaloperonospora brassicae]|uniref:PH domain-containing protein n=1 Tax=Hyaloperonospora brassicae TaxID=162125 RepID=A0AAV0TRD6_HYABA|nr:unnamed protein product [Hyaloperonospora brassicae]
MPGTRTQPMSQEELVDTEKGPSGLQLLSPSLQQSIQRPTRRTASSDSVADFGWSSTPTASHDARLDCCEAFDVDTFLRDCIDVHATCPNGTSDAARGFDFSSFTTASVRRQMENSERRDEAVQTPSSGWGSRGSRYSTVDHIDPFTTATTTTTTTTTASTATATAAMKKNNRHVDYSLSYYNDDRAKLNPLSCSMGSARTISASKEFDRQRPHSFDKKALRRTSVAARPPPLDCVYRGTFHLSSTAASSGFPLAKKKEVTAVVQCGWLEKRKGLVLKRWKPFYCLFKSDDSLCLYASEDTVNGRLEQRYQVLRVTLTDKNDSFHIIGVDSEGAPRREELRALVPREWARWFQVLCKFLDSSSMEHSVACKPELTVTRTFDETEEGDWSGGSESNSSGYRPTQRHAQANAYRGPCSQRKQPAAAVYESFDGHGDDKMSMYSSVSGSSSTPSMSASSRVSQDTALSSQAKSSCVKMFDCPMIELRGQGVVPMLGSSRASDSKRTGARPTASPDFSRTR